MEVGWGGGGGWRTKVRITFDSGVFNDTVHQVTFSAMS